MQPTYNHTNNATPSTSRFRWHCALRCLAKVAWELCAGCSPDCQVLVALLALRTRAQTFHAGVEDVDISLEQQKVVVKGQHLSPEQLIETVAKTGKETTLWAN